MRTESRADLHTHSFFSDGALLPSEMLRRAEMLGYGALAITDHADASNLEELILRLVRLVGQQTADPAVILIPGIEITHVPPGQIAGLAHRARRLGARMVVVHGETPVEPVAQGTNRAAVECGDVDILAHPGFVTVQEARLAASQGVALELSARGGHCLTNGHVAQMARQAGARLVVNTDSHRPSDMMDQAQALKVALGAGLTDEEARLAVTDNPWMLVRKALRAPSF